MDGKTRHMKKTNFDRYLNEQLQDPVFAARFEQAGEAWKVAAQLGGNASTEQRQLVQGCSHNVIATLGKRPTK
jgi:hypothetical protein